MPTALAISWPDAMDHRQEPSSRTHFCCQRWRIFLPSFRRKEFDSAQSFGPQKMKRENAKPGPRVSVGCFWHIFFAPPGKGFEANYRMSGNWCRTDWATDLCSSSTSTPWLSRHFTRAVAALSPSLRSLCAPSRQDPRAWSRAAKSWTSSAWATRRQLMDTLCSFFPTCYEKSPVLKGTSL